MGGEHVQGRTDVCSVCIVDGCQRPGGWEHVAGGGGGGTSRTTLVHVNAC